ncbi:alpha/beta fold hydrolase [Marinitenerispora sediminis]|uniref:Alpha/beta hydrolase n=1 Tax=Marinitenerispora sediminis TaxID=1931232 RepID=A0A368T5D1_9ACTN|nr:alpha/beta fold hydrolase [Marinitenerispora sediminis]RCV50013.1 alpha/beta hydrolase [Marinitenerispora sediminis]RCV54063.1 alpha/beta hydrolase [Marinitenerispora sediminis]RCV58558.1 alpha/beta hydrolase [Marinitenerispora sediminis]
MKHSIRASAAAALGVVAGVGLTGCAGAAEVGSRLLPEDVPTNAGELFSGTEEIVVDGRSVNVSCSGVPVPGEPVVVLLHGGGDDLTTMADLQETLSADARVCSYDRLGAGGSDQPDGPQDYDDIGETLTGVLDEVALGGPVVLAGHSMGGLIAARYAPDHPDRVHGLVLLDATSPTAIADLKDRIPESATGPAAELRAQTLAVFAGENPEQLVFTDGEVRSAGDIPVQVLQHGQRYLAEVPEYGPGLEEDWTAGQEAWLAVSSESGLATAENSGHYIHVDEPEVAVEAIERVTAQAAG